MKVLVVAAALALVPVTGALAADDKEHPPQKATEEATPEMKNPEGTEKLHPPQKAMDEATPTEKKSDAASAKPAAGGGNAKMTAAPDWDQRKAGEGVTLSGSKQN